MFDKEVRDRLKSLGAFELIDIAYWSEWESIGDRFVVELLTLQDVVFRISWDKLVSKLPSYKRRMLLSLQNYFKTHKKFDGKYHQYAQDGVPIFANSLAVRMSIGNWDYLMEIMPVEESLADENSIDEESANKCLFK